MKWWFVVFGVLPSVEVFSESYGKTDYFF